MEFNETQDNLFNHLDNIIKSIENLQLNCKIKTSEVENYFTTLDNLVKQILENFIENFIENENENENENRIITKLKSIYTKLLHIGQKTTILFLKRQCFSSITEFNNISDDEISVSSIYSSSLLQSIKSAVNEEINKITTENTETELDKNSLTRFLHIGKDINETNSNSNHKDGDNKNTISINITNSCQTTPSQSNLMSSGLLSSILPIPSFFGGLTNPLFSQFFTLLAGGTITYFLFNWSSSLILSKLDKIRDLFSYDFSQYNRFINLSSLYNAQNTNIQDLSKSIV